MYRYKKIQVTLPIAKLTWFRKNGEGLAGISQRCRTVLQSTHKSSYVQQQGQCAPCACACVDHVTRLASSCACAWHMQYHSTSSIKSELVFCQIILESEFIKRESARCKTPNLIFGRFIMPGYKAVVPSGSKGRLLCPECKLVLRDPVQTVEGVRLCKTCYDSIARWGNQY